MAVADPEVPVLFEVRVEEVEDEVAIIYHIRRTSCSDADDLSVVTGFSGSATDFFIGKLKRE